MSDKNIQSYLDSIEQTALRGEWNRTAHQQVNKYISRLLGDRPDDLFIPGTEANLLGNSLERLIDMYYTNTHVKPPDTSREYDKEPTSKVKRPNKKPYIPTGPGWLTW
ncbi:hypothetical protein HQ545_01740 [Candidatus Woesearchaeota archaeon]|nr:hypothetical protein [Candidatus Woesearchaeota archaeon]